MDEQRRKRCYENFRPHSRQQLQEPEEHPQDKAIDGTNKKSAWQLRYILANTASKHGMGIRRGYSRDHTPCHKGAEQARKREKYRRCYQKTNVKLEIGVILLHHLLPHRRCYGTTIEQHSQLGTEQKRHHRHVGCEALRHVRAQFASVVLAPSQVAAPDRLHVHRDDVLVWIQQPQQRPHGRVVEVGSFRRISPEGARRRRHGWVGVKASQTSKGRSIESPRFVDI